MTIVENLNGSSIDELVSLYSNEYWSKNRNREDVIEMLQHTDIVIAAKATDGSLLGFARVLTDYVYRATIYDVIVHRDHRGKDIGRALINAVLGHKKLQHVECFDLYCKPDMFPFYEKWGFTSVIGSLTLMRKVNSFI